MKHEQNALNAIRNHGGAVTAISGNSVMFAIGGKNFRIGEGDGPSCSEFSETIHRLVNFAERRPYQGAAIKAARDAYRCNVADAALWLWMNRMNRSTWEGFQVSGEQIIKMHAVCVDTAKRAKEFREGYPELHDFDGAEYVRASDYDERLHASDVYFDSWKNTEAQFNQHKLEMDAACGTIAIHEEELSKLRVKLDEWLASHVKVSGEKAAIRQRLTVAEQALKFYADGDHLQLADADAWDTCSGEPVNFLHDEAGTASVEDGSIAKAALKPAAEGEGS